MAVLGATALAALGVIFMNFNFHLANGSAYPWLVPADGFDEGVDLDSLLPLLEVVLLVVSAKLLLTLRRTIRQTDGADRIADWIDEIGVPATTRPAATPV